MAVDTAQYVGDFDASKPTGGDSRKEADDNMRQMKLASKQSFPNVKGAVTRTHDELNTVTDRALKAGDTYTGTHDFTGATSVSVPSPSTLDSSSKAAPTSFVMAAISAVNAIPGVTISTNATTAFSVAAGQIVAATNPSAVAVTYPPSPTLGGVYGVVFDNGLITNTVDLGANSLNYNGSTVTGVVTIDQRIPFVLRWFGDYYRMV